MARNHSGETLKECYTNNYLHFGQRGTSRVESGHWMSKRDLQVSAKSTIQFFERTITHQHSHAQQLLAEERVQRPLKLLIPLFKDVLNKVLRQALYQVLSIHDRYLPLSRGKDPINPECTGVTRLTMGFPCIHTIKEYFDRNQSLQLHQFHQHWRLYEDDNLPRVDPRNLILEPVVARPRDRPSGAINATQSQQTALEDSSTRRDPSGFDAQDDFHMTRERGQGLGGHGAGGGGARGGGHGGVRGGGHKGERGGRRRGGYSGIPAEMTGVLKF